MHFSYLGENNSMDRYDPLQDKHLVKHFSKPAMVRQVRTTAVLEAFQKAPAPYRTIVERYLSRGPIDDIDSDAPHASSGSAGRPLVGATTSYSAAAAAAFIGNRNNALLLGKGGGGHTPLLPNSNSSRSRPTSATTTSGGHAPHRPASAPAAISGSGTGGARRPLSASVSRHAKRQTCQQCQSAAEEGGGSHLSFEAGGGGLDDVGERCVCGAKGSDTCLHCFFRRRRLSILARERDGIEGRKDRRAREEGDHQHQHHQQQWLRGGSQHAQQQQQFFTTRYDPLQPQGMARPRRPSAPSMPRQRMHVSVAEGGEEEMVGTVGRAASHSSHRPRPLSAGARASAAPVGAVEAVMGAMAIGAGRWQGDEHCRSAAAANGGREPRRPQSRPSSAQTSSGRGGNNGHANNTGNATNTTAGNVSGTAAQPALHLHYHSTPPTPRPSRPASASARVVPRTQTRAQHRPSSVDDPLSPDDVDALTAVPRPHHPPAEEEARRRSSEEEEDLSGARIVTSPPKEDPPAAATLSATETDKSTPQQESERARRQREDSEVGIVDYDDEAEGGSGDGGAGDAQEGSGYRRFEEMAERRDAPTTHATVPSAGRHNNASPSKTGRGSSGRSRAASSSAHVSVSVSPAKKASCAKRSVSPSTPKAHIYHNVKGPVRSWGSGPHLPPREPKRPPTVPSAERPYQSPTRTATARWAAEEEEEEGRRRKGTIDAAARHSMGSSPRANSARRRGDGSESPALKSARGEGSCATDSVTKKRKVAKKKATDGTVDSNTSNTSPKRGTERSSSGRGGHERASPSSRGVQSSPSRRSRGNSSGSPKNASAAKTKKQSHQRNVSPFHGYNAHSSHVYISAPNHGDEGIPPEGCATAARRRTPVRPLSAHSQSRTSSSPTASAARKSRGDNRPQTTSADVRGRRRSPPPLSPPSSSAAVLQVTYDINGRRVTPSPSQRRAAAMRRKQQAKSDGAKRKKRADERGLGEDGAMADNAADAALRRAFRDAVRWAERRMAVGAIATGNLSPAISEAEDGEGHATEKEDTRPEGAHSSSSVATTTAAAFKTTPQHYSPLALFAVAALQRVGRGLTERRACGLAARQRALVAGAYQSPFRSQRFPPPYSDDCPTAAPSPTGAHAPPLSSQLPLRIADIARAVEASAGESMRAAAASLQLFGHEAARRMALTRRWHEERLAIEAVGERCVAAAAEREAMLRHFSLSSSQSPRNRPQSLAAGLAAEHEATASSSTARRKAVAAPRTQRRLDLTHADADGGDHSHSKWEEAAALRGAAASALAHLTDDDSAAASMRPTHSIAPHRIFIGDAGTEVRREVTALPADCKDDTEPWGASAHKKSATANAMVEGTALFATPTPHANEAQRQRMMGEEARLNAASESTDDDVSGHYLVSPSTTSPAPSSASAALALSILQHTPAPVGAHGGGYLPSRPQQNSAGDAHNSSIRSNSGRGGEGEGGASVASRKRVSGHLNGVDEAASESGANTATRILLRTPRRWQRKTKEHYDDEALHLSSASASASSRHGTASLKVAKGRARGARSLVSGVLDGALHLFGEGNAAPSDADLNACSKSGKKTPSRGAVSSPNGNKNTKSQHINDDEGNDVDDDEEDDTSANDFTAASASVSAALSRNASATALHIKRTASARSAAAAVGGGSGRKSTFGSRLSTSPPKMAKVGSNSRLNASSSSASVVSSPSPRHKDGGDKSGDNNKETERHTSEMGRGAKKKKKRSLSASEGGTQGSGEDNDEEESHLRRQGSATSVDGGYHIEGIKRVASSVVASPPRGAVKRKESGGAEPVTLTTLLGDNGVAVDGGREDNGVVAEGKVGSGDQHQPLRPQPPARREPLPNSDADNPPLAGSSRKASSSLRGGRGFASAKGSNRGGGEVAALDAHCDGFEFVAKSPKIEDADEEEEEFFCGEEKEGDEEDFSEEEALDIPNEYAVRVHVSIPTSISATSFSIAPHTSGGASRNSGGNTNASAAADNDDFVLMDVPPPLDRFVMGANGNVLFAEHSTEHVHQRNSSARNMQSDSSAAAPLRGSNGEYVSSYAAGELSTLSPSREWGAASSAGASQSAHPNADSNGPIPARVEGGGYQRPNIAVAVAASVARRLPK